MLLLNVSDLSTYLFCPRKVYFRHVLKKMEPANAGALRGNIIHKSFDDSISREAQILSKAPTEENFVKHFVESAKINISAKEQEMEKLGLTPEICASEVLPMIEAEARKRFSEVKKFISPEGKFLLGEIEPKLKSEFWVSSDSLGLKGKIDCMEMWKEKHVPVDFKSSSILYGVPPGDELQVAAYIMLLEKTYRKVSVPYGILRYLKSGKDVKVEASEELRSKVAGTRQKVLDLMELKKEPQKCKNSFCYVCAHF